MYTKTSNGIKKGDSSYIQKPEMKRKSVDVPILIKENYEASSKKTIYSTWWFWVLIMLLVVILSVGVYYFRK
jgi:hypothetical protein